MPGNDTSAEPLTSSDCDLRDFAYMPLDVRRLLTSDTWLEAADDPKLGHVLICLWAEAWHQVPAASLPDNDRVLARFAMCDGPEWHRLREQALEGWRHCSDGRLYHPVVAEKALEAWLERLMHRKLSAAGNAKRWGASLDVASITAAMNDACSRLFALNPRSRLLAKVVHPARTAVGIAVGSPQESHEDRKEKEKENQERKKDNAALSADRRRSSGSGEPYAFEAGVICLNAKNLEAWRKDYPNLSLEAELRSLSEWAGRPENAKGWFHAVQGGLAKRNRESALAVERVKAEATARAHAPPARQPSAYVP
ncbi:MAG: DUF1376 domain-containing protein [Microvirga sp.]